MGAIMFVFSKELHPNDYLVNVPENEVGRVASVLALAATSAVLLTGWELSHKHRSSLPKRLDVPATRQTADIRPPALPSGVRVVSNLKA